MAERVQNEVFRERYHQLERRGEIVLAEVAERMGFVTTDKKGRRKPDSSRVARMLGLAKDGDNYRKSVSYDNAVALCDALHLDYTEVGV